MSEIEIKRPVVVKVIMTDNFRNQLISEAEETLKRIEDNFIQMEKSYNAISCDVGDSKQDERRSQLVAEKERLENMRRELNWRVSELKNVPNGAEVPFRIFDSYTTLRVGDNFLNKMSQAEIVIKDWEITEIRGN